jgi:hypothetical protein
MDQEEISRLKTAQMRFFKKYRRKKPREMKGKAVPGTW